MRRWLCALAVALSAGCAAVDSAPLARLGVSVTFAPKNKCQGVSPRIRLTNVPAHVAIYEVEMRDLDAPGYQHWSETLPANGAVIPEGAGSGYRGPCPPFGQHRYEVDVTAKGAEGQPLAHGETIVPVAR